ncbi:MAG: hypothetical protein ACLPV8_04920 [Steroidobacteraceae bacterium]
MKHVFKSLSLLLLLMAAQQGAVVHELSHAFRAGDAQLNVGSGGVADTTCALCPAFAQAASPAFSHAFHVPELGRSTPLLASKLPSAAIDAAVPRPRSRGPPSLS